MSVHVLLNLLNELRKRDKMQGLPSVLSLFRNELNKFNKTGAGMLDSIYHMPVESLSTGLRSAVGNVSGNRCKSDCKSRGPEFDPGPVPYFRGD